MKKILLGSLLIGLLSMPTLGLAQNWSNLPNVGVENAFSNVTGWAFIILLMLAVFFIIVGGYYWVTAGGDAAKIGVARNYLIYALIGVAVAFMARGLVAFVNTVLQ
ncbi:MAG: hypothetical protein US98_C0003G0008 [Parcubacteria group bacterium GW2011_GWC1_38_6]|nr:MAG: hypothetical protein US98_C0003G0008 [Parcubacteria group bacterium GW2011_GWC1_38_6]